MSVTVRRLLMPPWDVTAPTARDARLLYRGNPHNPEHDSAGYRNPTRPAQAHVITLGDSHTYGPSNSKDGWPSVLEGHLHRTVYNMGMPGYGPGQNLLQLGDALSLRPGIVILAPYLGNDFFDAYVFSPRSPELLAGISPSLLSAAAAEERRSSIKRERAVFFPFSARDRRSAAWGPKEWVSNHVKLYGLLRALRFQLTRSSPPAILSRNFEVAVAALTPDERQYALPLDAGAWRTVLTPEYRGRALDDRDPRIKVGFEVTRAVLVAMEERCRAAGISFLVVVLPTKESVFWPRVGDPSRYPGLERLVRDEARLKRELVATLQQRGIAYVDMLEALRSSPVQTYYEDIDGHPNEDGHKTIAVGVAQRVRQILRLSADNAPFQHERKDRLAAAAKRRSGP